MVLTDKTLEDLLDYLDNSIAKLSKDTISNTEFHLENGNLKEFLDAQYEIRLDNLLQRKNSNIHHLESNLKNKIIQRKQKLLEKVCKEFKI
ncbi:MAG: hypothetical protein PVG43_08475 [Nitrosopumilaceae archaeon]|jgi:hypothetical protein